MNAKLVFRQKIAKLEEFVNARSLRERSLLLTSAVMLIFILWRNLILNYLSASTDQIIANKERLSTQITLMQGQIESLSEAIKNDSAITLERKLKNSISKNIGIQDKINQYISGLTSADEMIDILKSLVSEDVGLKIEKLESLEDRRILSEQSDILVYNKGLKIILEGDYISTVKFLQKLEENESKILWDTLIYQVIDYPLAKVTIILHTMGAQKGWLHV